MENKKVQNFLELYFEVLEENIEEVEAELKQDGIDTYKLQSDLLNLIKKKNAELKIEKGKQLKLKVEEIVKAASEKSCRNDKEQNYAIAAHKLGKLAKEDIDNIKKDALLLEDIGKLIDGDTDDTGKAGS